eukprot:g779.t1
MEFIRLQQLYRPSGASKAVLDLSAQTEEGKAFSLYKKKLENKEENEISGMVYNSEKGQVALSHGTKISFFAVRGRGRGAGGAGAGKAATGPRAESISSLNKFKDFTTCLGIRPDGKLLVGGEAGGSLAVIEWSEGSVLRRLRGHTNAPTCCGFSVNKTQILSGAKDRTLRLYDITSTSANAVLTWNHAHADFVQALCPSSEQGNVWLTGGAEGVCKLWDSRANSTSSNGCVATFRIDSRSGAEAEASAPVAGVKFFPGSTMFVAAAGSNLRIFDVRKTAGEALVTAFGSSTHTKELTDCDVSPSGRYLLSGSLDSTCRVWDQSGNHVFSFPHQHSIKVAKFLDEETIGCGGSSGDWVVRKKVKQNPNALAKNGEAADAQALPVKKKPAIGNKAPRGLPLTTRYYKRGADVEPVPGQDDEVVTAHKKLKLSQLEMALKSFEYKKALELALLNGSNNLSYALSFLDELESRSATRQAASDLGEEVCLKLLYWILSVIDLPEAATFRRLILNLFHEICDRNGCVQFAKGKKMLDVLGKIRGKVSGELDLQERTLRPLLGMLDTLLSQPC